MAPTGLRRRLRTIARALAWLQLASIVLACVGLALGEATRATFVLLYAPRWPLAVSGLAAVGLCAWLRDARLGAAQVVALLVALFPLAGLRVSLDARATRHPLRVRTWNVFYGRLGYDQVAASIVEGGADVTVLQASRERVGEACARRGLTLVQDGEFAIASRFPARVVEHNAPLADGAPRQFVRYDVSTPDGTLALFSVHPFSPRAALWDRREFKADVALRDRQIGAAIERARAASVPFVVVGDTNLPPGSRIGRARFAGLRDAFDDVGRGFGFTFPARLPWLRIDRFLGGPGVRFLSIETLGRGPSNHRAVEAVLELSSGS